MFVWDKKKRTKRKEWKVLKNTHVPKNKIKKWKRKKNQHLPKNK